VEARPESIGAGLRPMTEVPSPAIVPFLLGVVLSAGLAAVAPQEAAPQDPAFVVADTVPTFRHSQHEVLECRACHEMDRTHGARLVESVEDCRSCHHTQRAGRECAACHAGAEVEEETYVLPRTFTLTVLEEPSERDLEFSHGTHRALECVACHDDGPSLGVPQLDCQSCHEEHHAPDAATGCFQCHFDPTEDAHGLGVHQTCSGSGCHQEVPVGGPPRSRAGCLWCHEDMSDHRVGRECVSCHIMPRPIPESGGEGRR